MHEDPQVLNHGKPGRGVRLREGMTFTIEPMVNLGRPETEVLSDDWTAVTRDGKLSAQYEHSIGVTATGAELPSGTTSSVLATISPLRSSSTAMSAPMRAA